MTNEELYNLTCGHTLRPWWPAYLRLDCFPPKLYVHSKELHPDTAERLILGSAVMWLVPHCYARNLTIDIDEDTDRYVVNFSRPVTNGLVALGTETIEDSLLAAVLAACEAAYKAGGEK